MGIQIYHLTKITLVFDESKQDNDTDFRLILTVGNSVIAKNI